jgi:hypothetical protein
MNKQEKVKTIISIRKQLMKKYESSKPEKVKKAEKVIREYKQEFKNEYKGTLSMLKGYEKDIQQLKPQSINDISAQGEYSAGIITVNPKPYNKVIYKYSLNDESYTVRSILNELR